MWEFKLFHKRIHPDVCLGWGCHKEFCCYFEHPLIMRLVHLLSYSRKMRLHDELQTEKSCMNLKSVNELLPSLLLEFPPDASWYSERLLQFWCSFLLLPLSRITWVKVTEIGRERTSVTPHEFSFGLLILEEDDFTSLLHTPPTKSSEDSTGRYFSCCTLLLHFRRALYFHPFTLTATNCVLPFFSYLLLSSFHFVPSSPNFPISRFPFSLSSSSSDFISSSSASFASPLHLLEQNSSLLISQLHLPTWISAIQILHGILILSLSLIFVCNFYSEEL